MKYSLWIYFITKDILEINILRCSKLYNNNYGSMFILLKNHNLDNEK